MCIFTTFFVFYATFCSLIDVFKAVSVSLPTWKSTVGYEEGEDWVISKMRTGYPRFFIHLTIRELEQEILARYGQDGEVAMLFPSRAAASRCQKFILQSERPTDNRVIHVVNLVPIAVPSLSDKKEILSPLSAVFFPVHCVRWAKQIWQHSGDGISSRRAEFYLKLFRDGHLHRLGEGQRQKDQDPYSKGPLRYRKNEAVDSHDSKSISNVPQSSKAGIMPAQDGNELVQFVEERFGRNLNSAMASKAKLAIRRRIAGCLSVDEELDLDTALEKSEEPSDHRINGLTEDDVYLYPSGMSSIFNTHRMLLANRAEPRKSICFGFPYIDTLKILEKWGPGCLFYGHGSEADLDDLESRLKQGEKYLSLFTEFPGNPLLNTPNMKRIRSLADRYDFAVVVDETIGNLINVNTLKYADVVVSSLTKIFSGNSNVMGGSAVYNPNSLRYQSLKKTIKLEYEDDYWAEDAIFMERNSRNFVSRIEQINANAGAIAELLHHSPATKAVYYPKLRPSKTNYDACRNPGGGYGGLLSVTFNHIQEAVVFFDTLAVLKGPSLGTNFTLACPYVILAHYHELEWAAKFGVEPDLVRISVGLEDRNVLEAKIKKALDAVQALGLERV